MTSYIAVGAFKEGVRPKGLVFTWDWEGQPPIPGSLVEIELEPKSSGTKLTLRHKGLPAGEASAMHELGWIGILDRLSALEERDANKRVVRRFIEHGAAKNDTKVI